MDVVRDLVSSALRSGLRLTPDGDRLQVNGPKSTSNNILVERLRDAKLEVLALLRAEPELMHPANVRSLEGYSSEQKPYQQQEQDAMRAWVNGD